MKLKMLLPVALPCILLTSGCVPTALLVGATAGGAIVYDNRPLKQTKSDHRANQIAHYRLSHDAAIEKKCHISVSTYYGIMLLVGQAPTAELKQRAYAMVKNIPEVNRVYNEITVGEPSSLGQRADDAWITSKIRSKMLLQSGLRSTDIKVVTENGVVYLMGHVSHQQASLATNVARRVGGVRKVVKVFEFPY
ncbi:MAG: BON domain-containing protein [Coxiellaceae bacterium]|nr:BON domain-containing protein [Coxiellaceae bacterium]